MGGIKIRRIEKETAIWRWQLVQVLLIDTMNTEWCQLLNASS